MGVAHGWMDGWMDGCFILHPSRPSSNCWLEQYLDCLAFPLHAAAAPPLQVELKPLPTGVPETVAIVCSGRRATLTLRSQRVMHEGVDMSASKFEQLCGKGDAKKWKNSFWCVRLSAALNPALLEQPDLHGANRVTIAVVVVVVVVVV
jgi:hypothetical protein